MTIEDNKALIRRYYEEAPDHPEICEQIFAPQVTWHSLVRAQQQDFTSTPEEERSAYLHHKALWGGWSESIVSWIAEGDRVMVLWNFQGAHQAEYLGMPPSHKQVNFAGINIFRVENGRIAEVWNLWDQVGEWQQLGILPDTAEILQQAKRKHAN